jgi:Uma2 family endonuclease
MEVYKMLPEGTLAELIDNSLIMSPAPQFIHQQIQKRLTRKLDELIEDKGLGWVIPAPFDVFLDNTGNAVQPDITVVLTSNPGKFEKSFYGVPDMIFEVLSPGNSNFDLVRKKALYEKFGVAEYWAVNPETKECFGYSLAIGRYNELKPAVASIDSPLLKASFFF